MTRLDYLRLSQRSTRKPVKLMPEQLEEYAAFAAGQIEMDPDTGTAHLMVNGREVAWSASERES